MWIYIRKNFIKKIQPLATELEAVFFSFDPLFKIKHYGDVFYNLDDVYIHLPRNLHFLLPVLWSHIADPVPELFVLHSL